MQMHIRILFLSKGNYVKVYVGFVLTDGYYEIGATQHFNSSHI